MKLVAQRFAGALGLALLVALTGGWANYNPSGDIQAYAPGGGGGGSNANVITGDFTVNGNQTVSSRVTAGSVVNNGNELVLGSLTVNGPLTLVSNVASGWLQVGSGTADGAGDLYLGTQGSASSVRLHKYGAAGSLYVQTGSGAAANAFAGGWYLNGTTQLGLSFTGANQLNLVANTTVSTGTADIASNGNAIFGANPNNFVALDGNVYLRGLSDGTLQVTKADGSFPVLLLGPQTSSGVRIGSGFALTNGVGGNINPTANVWAGLRFTATGFLSGPILYGDYAASGTLGWIQWPTVTSGSVALHQATGTLTGAGFTFDGTVQIQGGAQLRSGSATPNGNVVGNVGDIYMCTAGGSLTTLWVKESGAGTNTGWLGK